MNQICIKLMHDMMTKSIVVSVAFFLSIAIAEQAYSQAPAGGDRFIRVAELGELVDSVNVWGDVNSAGRYLVPEGTNLVELISYSFGYNTVRGREAELDWSKTLLEVKVSRLNDNARRTEVAFFRYQYHDAEPIEMFEFDLQNNDIVTVQVRRRPSFPDYVRVIGPALGAVATSILLVDRLRGN